MGDSVPFTWTNVEGDEPFRLGPAEIAVRELTPLSATLAVSLDNTNAIGSASLLVACCGARAAAIRATNLTIGGHAMLGVETVYL